MREREEACLHLITRCLGPKHDLNHTHTILSLHLKTGAATNGFNFSYTVYNPSLGTSTVMYVNNETENTYRENKGI